MSCIYIFFHRHSRNCSECWKIFSFEIRIKWKFVELAWLSNNNCSFVCILCNLSLVQLGYPQLSTMLIPHFHNDDDNDDERLIVSLNISILKNNIILHTNCFMLHDNVRRIIACIITFLKVPHLSLSLVRNCF